MGIRRAVLGSSALLLLWAVVIAVTGGFSFLLFDQPIASRDPARPLIAALAVAAVYVR